MAAASTQQLLGYELDTGAISTGGAQASFFDLILIQVPAAIRANIRDGRLLIHGKVAGNPLTGFQLSWAPIVGMYAAGNISPVAKSTDFNTMSNVVLDATTNLYLTAAGSAFDWVLGMVPGELLFSVECAGALTLELWLGTLGGS